MYTFDKIKLNISQAVNQALKTSVIKPADLVYPPKPEFGDLSLPCYNIARFLNKSAVEVAEFLVGKIKLDNIVVATKVIGPFLNFTINKANLAEITLQLIQKMEDEYGLNKSGKNKKIMVEYSNANTHKEYHIGHLRNICYGDAVNKILKANGYKNLPVSYINDFGIHVAKTLWALKKFYAGTQDLGGNENKGYFLGKVYVRACQELEKNPSAQEEVALIMKKIESKKGEEYKLWQKTRKWSINGFAKIYQELGVKFDHIFYESELVGRGLDLVGRLYEKRLLIKSEGVIIADLQPYNLGILVILRSDGTALYPVADLPLAKEKFDKYKIDKSLYVVDIRQELYFKQLFKLIELMGYKKEMKHLGHEFVKLPDGLMSSRTGKVITYEELRAQGFKKAVSETKKRHKNWSEKKIYEVADKLVNGALKFEMLKVGADKIITFDINQALRFEGFTAAYLQYTYARINSIIKKSKDKSKKPENEKNIFINLIEQREYALVNKLAKYPEIVELAGKNYDPSEIAKHLFELAQEFNDYYHSVPVLKAKTDTRLARLALISSIKQVIKNGLNLLGIKVVEEM